MVKNYTQLFFVLSIFLCSGTASSQNTETDHDHFSIILNGGVGKSAEFASLDFGINLPRKDFVDYIPYIGVFLQHAIVESAQINSKFRSETEDNTTLAAAIGMKLGLIFPVNIGDFLPLYVVTSIAGGKSSVQDHPWWGKPEDSLIDDEVYEIGSGVKLGLGRVLIGYSYSISTANYLGRSHSGTVGYVF